MLTTLIRSLHTINLCQDITVLINMYNYGSKTFIPFSTVRVFGWLQWTKREEVGLILKSPTWFFTWVWSGFSFSPALLSNVIAELFELSVMAHTCELRRTRQAWAKGDFVPQQKQNPNPTHTNTWVFWKPKPNRKWIQNKRIYMCTSVLHL